MLPLPPADGIAPLAPLHARPALLSVGLAKTSLRQARSLKRKQSGGTD